MPDFEAKKPRIEDLKPGRELDALIAEKIFGWSLDPNRASDDICWLMPPGGWHVAKSVPQYSTDIAAAMEVVEKLSEYGWHFSLTRTADGSVVAFFHKDWFRRNEKLIETAPHAICLAALKAVGVI